MWQASPVDLYPYAHLYAGDRELRSYRSVVDPYASFVFAPADLVPAGTSPERAIYRATAAQIRDRLDIMGFGEELARHYGEEADDVRLVIRLAAAEDDDTIFTLDVTELVKALADDGDLISALAEVAPDGPPVVITETPAAATALREALHQHKPHLVGFIGVFDHDGSASRLLTSFAAASIANRTVAVLDDPPPAQLDLPPHYRVITAPQAGPAQILDAVVAALTDIG
ncbi:hypothetical protein Ahu01nite_013270 [Winogradskya humida]|uniref:Uncharacterized protein n=1 Tax=Winogradskya humida TaxID=113566 RepID=A0ABQ3ZI02_9ACTN|nr:hypothetical protein Ahu01nite_013270 [Actinoplanes humidus]